MTGLSFGAVPSHSLGGSEAKQRVTTEEKVFSSAEVRKLDEQVQKLARFLLGKPFAAQIKGLEEFQAWEGCKGAKTRSEAMLVATRPISSIAQKCQAVGQEVLERLGQEAAKEDVQLFHSFFALARLEKEWAALQRQGGDIPQRERLAKRMAEVGAVERAVTITKGISSNNRRMAALIELGKVLVEKGALKEACALGDGEEGVRDLYGHIVLQLADRGKEEEALELTKRYPTGFSEHELVERIARRARGSEELFKALQLVQRLPDRLSNDQKEFSVSKLASRSDLMCSLIEECLPEGFDPTDPATCLENVEKLRSVAEKLRMEEVPDSLVEKILYIYQQMLLVLPAEQKKRWMKSCFLLSNQFNRSDKGYQAALLHMLAYFISKKDMVLALDYLKRIHPKRDRGASIFLLIRLLSANRGSLELFRFIYSFSNDEIIGQAGRTSSDKDRDSWRFEAVEQAIESMEIEKAFKMLKSISEEEKRDQLLALLAKKCAEIGLFDRAVFFLKKIYSRSHLEGKMLAIYASVAVEIAKRGGVDRAISLMKELGSKKDIALSAVAILLIQRKKVEEALSLVESLRKEWQFLPLYRVAHHFMEAGEMEKALIFVEKASECALNRYIDFSASREGDQCAQSIAIKIVERGQIERAMTVIDKIRERSIRRRPLQEIIKLLRERGEMEKADEMERNLPPEEGYRHRPACSIL